MNLSKTILTALIDSTIYRTGLSLTDEGDVLIVSRSVRTGGRVRFVEFTISLEHIEGKGLCFAFDIFGNGVTGVRRVAPVAIDGAWLDGADIGDQADALFVHVFETLGLDFHL